VTVVDHLGTVSSNLEQRVQVNNEISQTEQRIDCLKQVSMSNSVPEPLNEFGM